MILFNIRVRGLIDGVSRTGDSLENVPLFALVIAGLLYARFLIWMVGLSSSDEKLVMLRSTEKGGLKLCTCLSFETG